jgi:hypothetical protein
MPGPGGFLASLPSPSPSTASTSTSIGISLPRPRSHPLRPGSAKEDTTRRYIETRLLHISRRYTKKFQPAEESDGVRDAGELRGYTDIKEVCKDLGEVIDVLWLSGTRTLSYFPFPFLCRELEILRTCAVTRIEMLICRSFSTNPLSFKCGIGHHYVSPGLPTGS